jgi:hypothetical protein
MVQVLATLNGIREDSGYTIPNSVSIFAVANHPVRAFPNDCLSWTRRSHSAD